jgi:hypothetical protein
MAEDVDRLRDEEPLRRLLAHYVDLGADDRAAWQDRLMELDDLQPPALARLHGELLAYGWLEMNVGAPPALGTGVVPSCYRATGAGRRALREAAEGPGLDRCARAEAA